MKIQARGIYTIAVVVFILLVSYTTYFTAAHPYIGSRVTNDPNKPITVVEVEPGALSAKSGIEKGDIILSINGEDPHKNPQVINYERIEKVTDIQIQKSNGEILELHFEYTLDLQTIFQVPIPLVLAILILYASYHIYKTNESNLFNKSSFYLIIFLFDMAIAYLSGGGSSRGELILRYLNIITFLSVPVLFLQFIYHYFSELGKIWFNKWFYRIGYLIVLTNVLIEKMPFGSFSILKTSNLLSFITLYFIAILVMMLGLKRIEYRAQRYLIKVLLISNVVAIAPFILFYAIPYTFFNVHIFPPVILAGFLLIIPIALVYQFLAEKIHDIDFLMGRIRYFLLIGLIPSIIGVSLVATTKGDNPALYSIRLFVFLLIIFIVTFYYKEILDFKFNRFSEKKNYQQSIFNYTESLRTANNINQVFKELNRTILDITLVSDIQLVEYQKNDTNLDYWIKTLPANLMEFSSDIAKCNDFIGQIIEVTRGFIINVGETDKSHYILVCTTKINTPKLTRDELSYLKTLAYYTNVTLETFLKIENLMAYLEDLEDSQDNSNPVWLNRVLYKLEEKQRSEVAKDLHDSVLQDLISFQKRFERASDQYLADKISKNDADKMMDDISKIIATTRETCYELRPNVLYDLGLKKGLERLAYQHENNTDMVVNMNINNLRNPNDLDVQLNIYRIVQELLNNAAKHSNASLITLILVNIKEKMVIHYEDDGIGSIKDSLFSKENGMGLSGVRERVALLNGTVDIETEPNKGFKVIIEI